MRYNLLLNFLEVGLAFAFPMLLAQGETEWAIRVMLFNMTLIYFETVTGKLRNQGIVTAEFVMVALSAAMAFAVPGVWLSTATTMVVLWVLASIIMIMNMIEMMQP